MYPKFLDLSNPKSLISPYPADNFNPATITSGSVGIVMQLPSTWFENGERVTFADFDVILNQLYLWVLEFQRVMGWGQYVPMIDIMVTRTLWARKQPAGSTLLKVRTNLDPPSIETGKESGDRSIIETE